ncbi:MAG: hypothetical protein JW789_05300 [Candidatus Aenigmarchaeota archaeon]|nr:hypothetical protein [Candidatus Aenigmarchaeota archaeon]
MKMIIGMILFLSLLLTSHLVESQAQQDLPQIYSVFDRIIDEIRMIFTYGDDRVNMNLEIREKEINSAIANAKNENMDEAIQNLNNAEKRLQTIQETVSLNRVDEIKENVEKTINRINNETDLPDEFEEYILEEEKTMLIATLTEKTFEYCKELAKEDFALMLNEEECNPDTAIPGLEEELKKLKGIQMKLFVELMLEIRSCIDDPGTCNCEANVNVEQKAKCEKMVALAISCKYKDDEVSCNELESMKPKEGDSFAESFVPDFLMNLFREKSYMIEYNIEPSDGVPEECWDENDKPECRQYDHLKETNDDWDDYGNFIGKRPENKEPTMKESIPQCFDENNNFLEEKCGKITIVRTEGGLVNYLIENEINGILGRFENKSEQNTIDVNGTAGRTRYDEIKEEIDGIKGQIAERTFAPGTSGVGEPGEKNETVVVNEISEGTGDGGLEPVIVTGEGHGDDGLTTEVKTDVVIDGGNQVDAAPIVKENEDVSPSPDNFVNVVDDGPGEPGLVDDD